MFLSILIPNYGFDESINKCFLSIEKQRKSFIKDFEILICDQSNKDDKQKVLDSAKSLSNVKFLFLKKPNVLEARKTLLANAKGKYIFFIDSDDFVEDGFFQLIYETLEDKNFPDLLITSYWIHTQSSQIINKNLNTGVMTSFSYPQVL